MRITEEYPEKPQKRPMSQGERLLAAFLVLIIVLVGMHFLGL